MCFFSLEACRHSRASLHSFLATFALDVLGFSDQFWISFLFSDDFPQNLGRRSGTVEQEGWECFPSRCHNSVVQIEMGQFRNRFQEPGDDCPPPLFLVAVSFHCLGLQRSVSAGSRQEEAFPALRRGPTLH